MFFLNQPAFYIVWQKKEEQHETIQTIKNKGTEDFGKLQLRLLRELEEGKIGREKAQYEVENFWMGALRRAVIDGDVEHGSLMAGQSVGLIHEVLPMRDIIGNLVREAEEELIRIQGILKDTGI